MKLLLGVGGASLLILYLIHRNKNMSEIEKQANLYFPVQSDSEIAAGHPIVGVA